MKKIYESPQSKIVILEYNHHILDTSKEPETTPSGEGTVDPAKAFNWFDDFEKEVKKEDFDDYYDDEEDEDLY